MRKIIALAGIALVQCVAVALAGTGGMPNYEDYMSTIIVANNARGNYLPASPDAYSRPYKGCISTGVISIGYYTVITTGVPGDTLNFYDAYVSSDQANRVSASTGFQVTQYGDFALDLTLSTGAYVTLDSPAPSPSGAARVRITYRIREKY